MRIIAGEFRGRALVAPKGRSTRPTSDRAREGLFSALASRLGTDVGGGSVLDAFAGSGALGLEALSRGAAHATFIEKDPRAVRALRENVASLGASERATVIVGETARMARGRMLPGSPFSLLFLDPPYRIGPSEVRVLIEALFGAGSLTAGAVIVWEHASAVCAEWPPMVEPLFGLSYGSTHIDAGIYARGGAS
jgi:16S rRNA (guanine966-N2)-methyltransferase